MTGPEILQALIAKRTQMVSNDSFSVGNVYGMNEAVDLVARALGTTDPEPFEGDDK